MLHNSSTKSLHLFRMSIENINYNQQNIVHSIRYMICGNNRDLLLNLTTSESSISRHSRSLYVIKEQSFYQIFWINICTVVIRDGCYIQPKLTDDVTGCLCKQQCRVIKSHSYNLMKTKINIHVMCPTYYLCSILINFPSPFFISEFPHVMWHKNIAGVDLILNSQLWSKQQWNLEFF